MKKFMLTCLMTLTVALTLSAATVDPEKKWAAVISAIAQVESEGNPKRVSKCGRYVGYLQISKILVRECNQILGKQAFTYEDRYDKQKSIDMFIVFQEHFNKEGNMEKAIRLWNSGDPNCMNRKRPTEGYYRRVMAKFMAQAAAK